MGGPGKHCLQRVEKEVREERVCVRECARECVREREGEREREGKREKKRSGGVCLGKVANRVVVFGVPE